MSSVPGTNVPPISFPGIASGIDYNSIISKLTSLTLAPSVTLNQQVATLNAANLELIKINGMLSSVQDALSQLSQPNIYGAFSAVSSSPNYATAQGIDGVTATPGNYVVQQTQLATATQVLGSLTAGHLETDPIGSPPVPADSGVPLAQSYAAIAPKNGATAGKVTINGVTVSYDVTTQSIQTIFANIQNAVRTQTGDTSFTIGFKPGTDVVQVTDANNPISLGSPADSGNLLTVMRLDQAQVNNTGSSGSVTATAGVGGVNLTQQLNSKNTSGAATNAGFATAATSGSFTINGVQIAVDVTQDNLADVINRINNSSAGVLASFNSATGQISLTNKNTGPQSIVLGASGDSSNFLSAAGLVGTGAQTVVGTQAKVVVQTPSGSAQTFYSNSNSVTNAIPGVQLKLLASSTTPFEVTVSQDSTQLVSAINTFVSAYNTAVNEIDQATSAPIVASSNAPSLPGQGAQQAYSGGVLWGNADVDSIKNQLEAMVSGLVPGNGSAYNSLSSIGLSLDSSFTVLTANQATPGATSSGPQVQTYAGTSGQLQALDPTKLQNALAANPSAVKNLFTGSQGIVNQMGAYLTGVTGLPTNSANGLVGSIPLISLMQGFENSNTSQIQSIQQQIQVIQDSANQQADTLRAEFVNTEATLAGYQALQQQLGSMFGSSGTSSSSSSSSGGL